MAMTKYPAPVRADCATRGAASTSGRSPDRLAAATRKADLLRNQGLEVRELTRDEVIATECQFYQPRAAVGSSGGAKTEYVYRVPHPFCAILYKTSPFDAVRMDIVALFVQPVGEEEIIGHTMMSIIDDRSTATEVRHFQLTIFGQDKPILENQRPRKLPLDPRAETPIRADKSSIMYRRWLTSKGVAYGVIPAP